jgi:hypothetical protein
MCSHPHSQLDVDAAPINCCSASILVVVTPTKIDVTASFEDVATKLRRSKNIRSCPSIAAAQSIQYREERRPPMESDFVSRYPTTTAEQRAGLRAAYAAVVEDLIAELRDAPIDPDLPDERSMRAVAEAAIRYARELTRDRGSSFFEARLARARYRFRDELRVWLQGLEDRKACKEAERAAQEAAIELEKKEERKRRRAAKLAKLGSGELS